MGALRKEIIFCGQGIGDYSVEGVMLGLGSLSMGNIWTQRKGWSDHQWTKVETW